MGGKSKPTIGYWYKPLLHLGFCQGPVDAVLELRGGDKPAWTGVQSESGVIYIDAKELWGGEKAEGGIQGDFDVMMGEADQMPSAYLAANLGPDQSAFRGKVTGVFQGGLYGAFNPYPKPLAMKTRRILKGWDDDVCWYPEKAAIVLGSDGEGAVTFVDSFNGGLGSYTPTPGPSLDGFSEVPYSGGSALQIDSEATATARTISRDVPSGTLLAFSVEFVLGELGSNDFAVIYLYGPTGLLLIFNVHREAGILPGGNRLPTFWIANSGLDVAIGAPIGSEPLTVLGAYRFDAAYSADTGTWNAGIYLGSSLVASVSVPVSSWNLEVDTLSFQTESPTGLATFYRPSITRLGTIEAPQGMNAVHILYDSICHPQMQGEPSALIDDANFRAAADRAFDEGFGLCTEHDPTSETVEDFQKRILNVLGASLSQSRTDGKYRLTLVRDDYVLDDLPILGDDNILEYSEEATDPLEAVNQVSVEWFDPVRKETRTAGPLQSLGAIQAAGGVIAETVQHPEIPYEDLALRVGARNLGTKSVGLKRFELTTDRTPYAWRGGQFFRLQAPRRGIADMVCMVGDVSAGTRRSGAMRLQAIQDVSRMPMTTYVVAEPGVDTSPSQAPTVPPHQVALEAPYFELATSIPDGELSVLATDAGFLLVAAARPTAGVNFDLWTAVGTEGLADRGDGDWCPAARAADASSPVDTVFALADATDLDDVVVGQAALLGAEICRVEAVTVSPPTVVLARGCADTTPRAHLAGEEVMFFGGFGASDSREYSDGELVQAKLLSRTSSALLPLIIAPTLSVDMASRAARPYPPGRLRITDDVVADAAYPAVAFGQLAVSWTHRDRVLQDDQLVDEAAASIGPEAGTTYTVRYYLDDVLEETESGIAGTTATPYTLSGNGSARVEVEAVRDGLTSWQAAIAEFTYLVASSSGRIIVGGDRRVSVGGDARVSRG